MAQLYVELNKIEEAAKMDSFMYYLSVHWIEGSSFQAVLLLSKLISHHLSNEQRLFCKMRSVVWTFIS